MAVWVSNEWIRICVYMVQVAYPNREFKELAETPRKGDGTANATLNTLCISARHEVPSQAYLTLEERVFNLFQCCKNYVVENQILPHNFYISSWSWEHVITYCYGIRERNPNMEMKNYHTAIHVVGNKDV